MKRKKVNPRRQPRTQADVDKAKDLAIDACWAIFFSVLRDKEGMENEQLRRIWNEVENLSDSIGRNYVDVFDLADTLKEEAGIVLEGFNKK